MAQVFAWWIRSVPMRGGSPWYAGVSGTHSATPSAKSWLWTYLRLGCRERQGNPVRQTESGGAREREGRPREFRAGAVGISRLFQREGGGEGVNKAQAKKTRKKEKKVI